MLLVTYHLSLTFKLLPFRWLARPLPQSRLPSQRSNFSESISLRLFLQNCGVGVERLWLSETRLFTMNHLLLLLNLITGFGKKISSTKMLALSFGLICDAIAGWTSIWSYWVQISPIAWAWTLLQAFYDFRQVFCVVL